MQHSGCQKESLGEQAIGLRGGECKCFLLADRLSVVQRLAGWQADVTDDSSSSSQSGPVGSVSGSSSLAALPIACTHCAHTATNFAHHHHLTTSTSFHALFYLVLCFNQKQKSPSAGKPTPSESGKHLSLFSFLHHHQSVCLSAHTFDVSRSVAQAAVSSLRLLSADYCSSSSSSRWRRLRNAQTD